MCIVTEMEHVVARFPHKVAIESRDGSLTYAELNTRANAFAHHLTAAGVERGDVVALLMGSSIDIFVAMLAVLKSGAAYLPLDDKHPPLRKKKSLEDARVTHVVSNRDCRDIMDADRGMGFTDISSFQFDAVATDMPPPCRTGSDDKAYVMFTSGSTGDAKGVVVPHRAIVRLVIDTNYIRIASTDKILQLSPLSFDASTFEIWGALLNGATLALSSSESFDPNLLKKDIAGRGITILWLTAALFHLIADKYADAIKPLKTLLAGGDVLSPRIVNKVLDDVPGITVINGYGPTENTTFTCCHRMTEDNRPSSDGVPIGVAITGTKIFILDEALSPVAAGEVGQLYTSGEGIALGYINGDRAGAFFRNEKIAEGLIYCTGDLVRENARHEVEFVGRKDNLVKVRGFRVSLDGIRSSLLQITDVVDACVLIKKEESGGELLVAFVKTRQESQLDAAEIRRELRVSLAPYMIPDSITVSDILPITNNGKLDRKVLSLA